MIFDCGSEITILLLLPLLLFSFSLSAPAGAENPLSLLLSSDPPSPSFEQVNEVMMAGWWRREEGKGKKLGCRGELQ